MKPRKAERRMSVAPRWSRTLLAAAGATILIATFAAADPTPVVGRHTERGRFATTDQGYPPQPVGLRDVRELTPGDVVGTETGSQSTGDFAGAVAATGPGTGRPDVTAESDTELIARAVADPEVAVLLGEDAELIGVAPLDRTEPGPRSASTHTVTWYLPDLVDSVVATVGPSGVSQIEEVPAVRWQPPLTGDERRRAVLIAHEALVDEGFDGLDDLEGFAMHVMDPDGSYPATRMAYVTFAEHIDARPQVLAWVDLTTGTLQRWRTESGQPSPVAPSHSYVPPSAPAAFAESTRCAPRQGVIADWNGWSFGYEVSARNDGIALTDVTYDGVLILKRASMPAMTVFYDNTECGPFVDRLGGEELTPVDWAGGADVVVREFDQYGTRWLELGVLDILGEYVLYQSFYVGEGGQLDAHTFAKGLQCDTDHVHYPFWRFDFDIAGADEDEIRRVGADGVLVVEDAEFDLSAAEAVGHSWQVRDRGTGHRVDLAFDDGSWNVPGEVVPEALFDLNRVYGRRYQAGEATTWRYPAVTELPGNNLQDIGGQDLVLWYRGLLPHSAEEGPALWHSTGVRLTVLPIDHFNRSRGG